MLIGVVVHPINALAHPSVPPGFRWGVYLEDRWADLSRCMNAGWAPTANDAAMSGEAAAICAVRAAQACGRADARMETTVLDYDPTAGAPDLITIGGC